MPAGFEAARVSASRGHEVVLFEAANEPGGQVRLAARATWRRDLVGIVHRGRTDLDALARGAPQPLGPAGTFSLFRVGDAVASRNIHAALYDALRICKDL